MTGSRLSSVAVDELGAGGTRRRKKCSKLLQNVSRAGWLTCINFNRRNLSKAMCKDGASGPTFGYSESSEKMVSQKFCNFALDGLSVCLLFINDGDMGILVVQIFEGSYNSIRELI